MKRIIGFVLMIALSVSMLIGCSSNDVEEVEAPQEAAPISEEYTIVDMAGREITMEQAPQKVAISYLPHWETLIMLDLMPIATTSAVHYASTWGPFEGMDLSSVVDLGDTEINLELLAQLEPDLILQQVADTSKIAVENLEAIAPVAVYGERVKMDWRYSLTEIGKAVGRSEKAAEVIAEVDSKLKASREKLEAGYNDKTVMLMSLMGKDRYFCAYRPDIFDKETGLGLNAPEGYPTEETYIQVSMEAIVEMDPDYIFVSVFAGNEALYEELSNNSVWKSLKAVKNGNVFTLDGSGHAASAMSTVRTIDAMVESLLTNK